MKTELRSLQRDNHLALNYIRDARDHATVMRWEFDTMNGRLNMYVGRVDGIRIRVNETWETMRAIQAEQTQQSTLMRELNEMIRQLLGQHPPPPDDGTSGSSFLQPHPF